MKHKRPVICNDCGETFHIKKIRKKFMKDGLHGKIEIQYFSCPKCKKKYVTSILNDKLKDRVKETRKLQRQLKTITDPSEAEEIFKKYEEMKKENLRITNELKFYFAKYV